MSKLVMGLNQILVSTQKFTDLDVSEEQKVRVVIENAQAGNTVIVRGKLSGQSSYVDLVTLTGNANETINVFTYELIEIECTVYSSLSNNIKIIARSFNAETGSSIESIGVTSGDTLTDLSDLDFTSSDNSIEINGDNTAKAIDLTVTDTFADSITGGIPEGVVITPVNKSQAFLSKEGLILQQLDSATQTNTAGAYNGGGTGQKLFVEVWDYNNVPLSQISSLSFNAKNLRDGGPTNQQGNFSFNILQNFNSGLLTTANDYAILVADGQPELFTNFFIVSNTAFTDYTVSSSTRSYKCVGGTGVINFTGNTTIGSNEVTNVSGTNINALTVGMYVRKTPTGVTAAAEANMPFPDGSVINSIDIAGNKFTVYYNGSPANATVNGTGTSFKQYGGIAPEQRTGTAAGTVVTLGGRTIDGVVTTQDLQVNMKVIINGNSYYIVSMVANVSITLNITPPAGAVTMTFQAIGKTGIPGNVENIGIPLSVIHANNPNAYITNNAPHTSSGWAANDGGAPKNILKQGGIQLNMGSSSITTNRTNILKSLTINSTQYKFTK